MPDYGRFCPVALTSDVLADRWTPLIVRELVLGNTRFNDIARCLPGISRTLLVQRLKHLERKGVVERWPLPLGRGFEYHLTPAGKDLEAVIVAMGRWSVHWLFDEIDLHDVDVVQLTWWLHRRIDAEQLPPSRVVIQFDHTAPVRRSIWMVLDRGEASVCVQHPGFEPDLVVTTTTTALAAVFQGFTSWPQAVAGGQIVVRGPLPLVRDLHRWFRWSRFHDEVARHVARHGSGRAVAGAVSSTS